MGQRASRQKKRDRRKFQDERKHQNAYNTYATEDIDVRDYRDYRQNWQIGDCRAAQVPRKAKEDNTYATEGIDVRDYKHYRQNWQIGDCRAAQVPRKAKEDNTYATEDIDVQNYRDYRQNWQIEDCRAAQVPRKAKEDNPYAREDIDFREHRDNRHNVQNWQIGDCRADQVTRMAKEDSPYAREDIDFREHRVNMHNVLNWQIRDCRVAQDPRKAKEDNPYAREDIDFREHRDNMHNVQNWQIRDCRADQVPRKAKEDKTYAREDIDFREHRDNRHKRQNLQIRDCRAAQVTRKANEEVDTDYAKAIRRVFVDLVEYLDPAPILDRFVTSGLFKRSQIRDIVDRTSTSDKTRELLWKIIQRGEVAYNKLKEYLKETNQSRLVQLLEKAERGEDTSEIGYEISTTVKQSTISSHQRASQELQKDLVCHYRECHSKISVSPLIMDNDVPIEEFYVQPPMDAIDLQRRYGNPTRTPVTSYKLLLFRDDESTYKNIYVTADAGVGKTAFTRKICTTWCQAHSPMTSLASKYDDDDINAAQYFEFLFLIPLRDADGSLCDLDKLIESLVEETLPRRHNRETLAQILQERTCLVILDGLDEWCHSESCSRRHHEHDIPHRKRRPNWTILSTTRPWKFDVLRLASYDVDRHVEIKELDEESSEQLVSNAVNLLNEQLTDDRPKKSVEEFYQTTSSIDLGEIRQVPYIYLQSVCLWFEGNDIGGSKCAIYTNVLELTLKRGIQKIKPGSRLLSQEEDIKMCVPKCMMEKEYCMQHLTLLLKLGKLAFYTLFGTENQQLLVFDVRIATKYLTNQELDYYLKLGILSQNKGYGSVATKISNISFQHKSLHEYFSALYIQSNDIQSSDRDSNIQDLVDKTCTTLPSILEMFNVFIFLSGFRPTVYSDISHIMLKYVTRDEHTVKHRKSLSNVIYETEYKVIGRFQTLQLNCLQEMLANEHDIHSLPIEDIVINEDSKDAESVSVLQKLVHQNSDHLKSFSICQCENTEEATNIIEALNIQYLHSLDKLELRVVARQPVVEQLLRQSMTTLQYLCLKFVTYEQGEYNCEMTVLSDVCEEMVLGMPLLQGLRLGGIIVTHDQLEKVTKFLTSRVTMTVISMDNITCSDHNESCSGVQFNLSEHDNLQMLGLYNVPVSQLQVNTQQLEKCVIGGLPSCVVTSCLTSLTTAHNLKKLYCVNLSEHDLTSLITNLPALLQLEELYITDTDLADRRLDLTDMTRLQFIQLLKVSMTSSDLRALSRSVCTLAQSVRVVLLGCTVTPDVEYETVKEEIRQSDNFTVIHDGPIGYHQLFSFNTVK